MGCKLFTEWRSAVELRSASKRTDGPGSSTRRRALWSPYDQPKLSLAGLAAQGSDFWELLGATRAQTSGLARFHGAVGELQHEYVQKTGVFKGYIREKLGSCPKLEQNAA